MNYRSRTFRGVAAAGAVLLAGGMLAACGSDDDGDAESGQDNASEVSISDVWARSGTAGGNTAVYMEITGGTEQSDLVGASVPTDVATDAQIHETMGGGGMAEEEGTDDHSGDETDEMSGDEMSGDDMSGDASTDGSEGDVSADGADDMSDDMDSMDGDDADHGDGMMSMQEVSAIAIPAGETIALAPGGFHIMLFDLASDLTTGDSVELTLSFENGYKETVTAEVRDS